MIMRHLYILILLFPFISIAQDHDTIWNADRTQWSLKPRKVTGENLDVLSDVKIDENGCSYFERIAKNKNASSVQLYKNGKTFMVNSFNSAKHVIQMDDKDLGIIIGKGYMNSSVPPRSFFGGISNYKIDFTMKLEFKEGRSRMQIKDISITLLLKDGDREMPCNLAVNNPSIIKQSLFSPEFERYRWDYLRDNVLNSFRLMLAEYETSVTELSTTTDDW